MAGPVLVEVSPSVATSVVHFVIPRPGASGSAVLSCVSLERPSRPGSSVRYCGGDHAITSTRCSRGRRVPSAWIAKEPTATMVMRRARLVARSSRRRSGPARNGRCAGAAPSRWMRLTSRPHCSMGRSIRCARVWWPARRIGAGRVRLRGQQLRKVGDSFANGRAGRSEDFMGWRVQSISASTAKLQRNDRTIELRLYPER
jgi:hypothetical protein